MRNFRLLDHDVELYDNPSRYFWDMFHARSYLVRLFRICEGRLAMTTRKLGEESMILPAEAVNLWLDEMAELRIR